MVKNIKAAYKDGIVTLTWDKAAGADKYLVYRKDNGKWKNAGTEKFIII